MALLFHTLRAAGLAVALYATFDALDVTVVGFEDSMTFTAFPFTRKLVAE
jgi:hypothetical protein